MGRLQWRGAMAIKDLEAERESWNWQIHAIKRPNGWRKAVGHRTTSLDARRSAGEYLAKWLAATALEPDVAQLARGSLALFRSGSGRCLASRSAGAFGQKDPPSIAGSPGRDEAVLYAADFFTGFKMGTAPEGAVSVARLSRAPDGYAARRTSPMSTLSLAFVSLHC